MKNQHSSTENPTSNPASQLTELKPIGKSWKRATILTTFHSRRQSRLSLLYFRPLGLLHEGQVALVPIHDCIGLNLTKGRKLRNPIRSSVLKCDSYREFETADLIGFPLFDSIQSYHVSRATCSSFTRPSWLREWNKRKLGQISTY